MVYTDGIHLIADTVEELHTFSASIGLKRCWYSNKRGKHHPHYDLWGKYLKKSLDNGAKLLTTRDLIKHLK